MRRVLLAYSLWFLGIVLWTIWPIVCVVVASFVASSCGCELNEANAHQCVILGIDVGPVLYDMFVMGWLMLVTIPTGVAALAVLLAVMTLHLMWHSFRCLRQAVRSRREHRTSGEHAGRASNGRR